MIAQANIVLATIAVGIISMKEITKNLIQRRLSISIEPLKTVTKRIRSFKS